MLKLRDTSVSFCDTRITVNVAAYKYLALYGEIEIQAAATVRRRITSRNLQSYRPAADSENIQIIIRAYMYPVAGKKGVSCELGPYERLFLNKRLTSYSKGVISPVISSQ